MLTDYTANSEKENLLQIGGSEKKGGNPIKQLLWPNVQDILKGVR